MRHPDSLALVADLEKALGKEQVKFDSLNRMLYSTDASNYQILPIGVTFPRHGDDVVAIHEIAARHTVPILPRGGGSSLAGQSVGRAVVMDFSRHMRKVRSIQGEVGTVVVESGAILGQLNRQLAPLGWMFGPDPASAERATIGGCVANNSSGSHSILYGMTADHVRRLEVVLASGERTWLDADSPTLRGLRDTVGGLVAAHQDEIRRRFPKIFRTVAGYALNKINPAEVDLTRLFTGSEGTLGTIISAELALVPHVPPSQRRLALVHFDSLHDSLTATPRILEVNPSAVELIDRSLIESTRRNMEYARHLTFIDGDPAAVLVVEFYGQSESELNHHIATLKALLKRIGHHGAITLAETPEEQARVWRVRKDGLGLLMSNRSESKPIAFIEDAAVPVENLADYIRDVEAVIHREGTTYSIYAHASAGCLHVRPLVNLKTAQGRHQYRAIAEAATDLTIKYGGTTTGEHGEGIARGEFSQRLFGPDLVGVFKAIKTAFDPDNRMNPGKIVDAPPMDSPELLRYTPEYEIIPIQTRYDWARDGGFNGAVEMCNGAGVCRKEGTGTMCPSYMATLDEAHSTRGRANALRMAISGHIPDALGSQGVHEVLDLCLSCKACKAECPSSVDMARLKSEATALYHDTHGVKLKTRVFANIHRLNWLGSLFPRLSNAILESRLGGWAARLAGIPTDRPLPKLAARRFTATPHPAHAPQAILIVDTFTEYNHPEVGEAFLKIAAVLGIEIGVMRLPGQGCCGRPAISKGVLDLAKSLANRNVQALAHTTTPLIFLEPSCQSAFTDDYLELVDSRLAKTAQEVAARCISAENWLFEQMKSAQLTWHDTPHDILLHGHCHQKALWGTASAQQLLKLIPQASVKEIDSGCCGVAGSFGYEHYDLSMKIANQRLLPAIEAATVGTVVTAAGTSCRTQISEAGHPVLHPIEVIAQSL